MASFNWKPTVKRLSNRYRLTIINDDTYEELTQFTISRISVYMAICTIFVLLVGATIALLWFTPLKQLTPGYKQGYGVDAKYKQLKLSSDSVYQLAERQQRYIDNLKTLLNNATPIGSLDTTVLQLPTDNALPNAATPTLKK